VNDIDEEGRKAVREAKKAHDNHRTPGMRKLHVVI
jgi:hypothetical protein